MNAQRNGFSILMVMMVLLLAGCPNGGGNSDSEEEAISLPLSGNARVASDGAGNFIAVWESGVRIVARYYTQGVGGQDIFLGEGTRPRVVLTPQYGHVVWSQLDEVDQPDIQGRVYDVASATWRQREITDGFTGSMRLIWPDVDAVDDTGMVVFQRWGGSDSAYRDVHSFEFLNVIDDNSSEPLWYELTGYPVVDEPLQTGSSGRTEPKVSVAPNRQAMAVWVDSNDDSLHVTKFTASQATPSISGINGNWFSAGSWTFLNTGIPVTRSGYDIAMFAHGDAMVMWLQGNRLIAKRYDVASNSWEIDQLLAVSAAGSDPALAVHDLGYGLIVQKNAGSNDVRAHHFFPDQPWSSAWQTPIVLSGGGQITGNIDLAISNDGSAIAVWVEDGEVTFSLFDGLFWDIPMSIGAGSTPQVALEDNNSCLIVWERDGFIFDYNCNVPSPRFTFSPIDPMPGTEISFDASASADSAGSISSYQWDFNNNGNFDATGITTAHTYDIAGTYRVRLRVTNDRGFSNDAVADVTVSGGATLTVNTTGNGNVTSTPPGIDCGGFGTDCIATYAVDTMVTLNAVGQASEVFSGWSGDCTGLNSSITITMSAARNCSATFMPVSVNVAVLTVGIRLDGAAPGIGGPFGGDVSSVPVGILCGSQGFDCEEGYVGGSSVVLTATADTGYRFQSWSGGCGGFNTATTITLTANTDCIANFISVSPGTPILVVDINGSGRIDSNPAGIACGSSSDCDHSFPLNSTVNLAAAGTVLSTFQSWSGDCSGGAFTTLIMDSNKFCTANFSPAIGNRRLTINVVGNGAVSTADGGISCPGDCVEDYITDTGVNVLAIPDAGYRLLGWSDDCADLADTTNFILTMQTNRTCTATFGL